MSATSRRLQPAIGWICLLVGGALAAYTLRVFGYSVLDQVKLAVTLAVTTLAPGWALSTWAARSPWVARLSAAFVCGLPVQLLGWLVGITTGITALMWVVPLLVAAVLGFLFRGPVLRELRGHRPAMPAWGSITLLVAWVAALIQSHATWSRHLSGRHADNWNVDFYWHLAIDASAMHRIPLTDPQAIGETLNYHWLSNAHSAALAKITGLDPTLLVFAGWPLATVAATAGLAFGLAHYLSRTMLAGVIAATLTVLPPMFAFDRAVEGGTANSFVLDSPSHMFSLPIITGIAWLVVVLFRAGGRRRLLTLPALGLLVLISPGVKVSLLPVVLCGLVAALGILALSRRSIRLAAALVVGVLVVIAVTYPVFGGGGGGSDLNLFAAGQTRALYAGSWDALAPLGPNGRRFLLLGFVLLLFLNHAWALVGLAGVRWRDPVVWFLGGTIASALVVTQVLIHPSNSQTYFAQGAQPVLAVVTGVGLAYLAGRGVAALGAANLAWAVAPAAALALPLGLVVMGPSRLDMVTGPMVLTHLGIIAAVSLTTMWLVRSHGPQPALTLVWSVVLVFSLGMPAGTVVSRLQSASFTRAEVVRVHTAIPPSAYQINPDEMAATRWAAEELPVDAVIATNVHCRNIVTEDGCDARGFWVGALTQRQVLLGGWAFTNLGRSSHGIDGISYVFQPYPDRDVFSLNESAFTAPSAGIMAELRELGVTHLFASARASSISAELSEVCDVEFTNDAVTVCRVA